MMQVEMQVALDEGSTWFVPSEAQCLEWSEAALVSEWADGEVELVVRVVDANESQSLNAQYRQKDKPTNVLSFPFENPPGLVDLGEALPYLGDLVICAEIVDREAKEQGKPVEAHWAHMIVHGCLHLQGFDHINDEDAEEMERLETEILKGLGFESPYESSEH